MVAPLGIAAGFLARKAAKEVVKRGAKKFGPRLVKQLKNTKYGSKVVDFGRKHGSKIEKAGAALTGMAAMKGVDYAEKNKSKLLDKAKMGGAAVAAIHHGLKNTPKVLAHYKKTGALTYPGSRYIGPGNTMFEGRPVSQGDKVAFKHDQMYGNYQAQGLKPHKYYNDSDRWARKKANKKTVHGMAVYLGMTAKKLTQKRVNWGLDMSKVHDYDTYNKIHKQGGQKNQAVNNNNLIHRANDQALKVNVGGGGALKTSVGV